MVTMRKRDAYVDDDDMVPDGGSVRRRLILMDGRFADHRPGYRMGDAADRKVVRDARDAMIRRAENAWRDARRRRDDDEDDDDELDNNDRRSISDARAMAMRKASYMAWRARLADAWRMSPTRDGPGGADAEELLRRHLGGRDHENVRIPPPTDPGYPNEDLVRRHLTTETTASAQAKRDCIWKEYRDRLSTAWQMGQTNPANATAIEKQAEAWRGGK
jgi:hypothetical protein